MTDNDLIEEVAAARAKAREVAFDTVRNPMSPHVGNNDFIEAAMLVSSYEVLRKTKP